MTASETIRAARLSSALACSVIIWPAIAPLLPPGATSSNQNREVPTVSGLNTLNDASFTVPFVTYDF